MQAWLHCWTGQLPHAASTAGSVAGAVGDDERTAPPAGPVILHLSALLHAPNAPALADLLPD